VEQHRPRDGVKTKNVVRNSLETMNTKVVDILRGISVYIGEDRIVIQPSYTYGKIWGGKNGINCKYRFSGFQILTIRHSAPVSEILDAIDQMSARCLDDVPAPTDEDRKTGLQLLLKATGEKTWNAITRSYAHISVTEYGQERTFSPLIPEKGAFTGTHQSWSCNFSNREQMEAAFKQAALVAIEAQNLHNLPPLG
jgi:hypothetical protein